MPVTAWIGALLIGVTMGLLGSGGSILTIPALVYLVDQPEKVAIAGSLLIVGTIALLGSVLAALRKTVDWPRVVVFGLPGMAGSYLGASLSHYVSGAVQLLMLGVVMLPAAALLLRADDAAQPRGGLRVALGVQGFAIGVLTGFVGVGGGFLIVPALVLLGGVPMHVAVGTSVTIIALTALTGFWEYVHVLRADGLQLDWFIIIVFIIIGMIGTVVGHILSARLPQELIRRLFAIFLVVIGAFVLWQSARTLG